jgi:hypothetical protein
MIGLLELLLAVFVIAGVLLLLRLRLGILIGLLLLPVILVGALGTMFFAAVYLILISVAVCALVLGYAMVKSLSGRKRS